LQQTVEFRQFGILEGVLQPKSIEDAMSFDAQLVRSKLPSPKPTSP